MQSWSADAVVALLRLLHAVIVPDLGVVGLVAVVTVVAAVALTAALIAVLAGRPSDAEVASPPVDGIRSPRTIRPDWARPDAPGRRLPRAPGSALAA